MIAIVVGFAGSFVLVKPQLNETLPEARETVKKGNEKVEKEKQIAEEARGK